MSSSNSSILSFIFLARILSFREHSQYEIIEKTGLANSTVSKWLAKLHQGPDNLVYIHSWKRVGGRGNWTAMWAWGYKMLDAPKPKPLTSSQYNKRWRAKQAREGITIVTEQGIKHVTSIQSKS